MIVGIVADDLTGAADAIAPFAGRGYHAVVDFVTSGPPAPWKQAAHVSAWTTFNRDDALLTDAHRIRRARAVARRARMAGARLLYQKIDSTLRGCLRIDLDSLRLEAPDRIAIVCPAFPANGRTVRAGILHVDGETRQRVRDAFGMGDDASAIDLSRETLLGSSSGLPERLMDWKSRGIRTVFCDAESMDDLRIIARAVVDNRESVLPVGSAGLAAAIAEQYPCLPAPLPQDESVREALRGGRVLVSIGSMNAAARRQARCLAARAGLEPIVLASRERLREAEVEIRQRFAEGERIVLIQSPDDWGSESVSELMPGTRFLGRLRTSVPDLALVVTGGETAAVIVVRLPGCHGIEIEGEFEAGVVTGRLRGTGTRGGWIDGLPILLKAGGFGDDELLARCVGV